MMIVSVCHCICVSAKGACGHPKQCEHHAAIWHQWAVSLGGSSPPTDDPAALGSTQRDTAAQQGSLSEVSTTPSCACVILMLYWCMMSAYIDNKQLPTVWWGLRLFMVRILPIFRVIYWRYSAKLLLQIHFGPEKLQPLFAGKLTCIVQLLLTTCCLLPSLHSASLSIKKKKRFLAVLIVNSPLSVGIEFFPCASSLSALLFNFLSH